jgi:CheY-specific phosphatase CheX
MFESEQDLKTLGRTVIGILEEAAFLFCEPLDDPKTLPVAPEVFVAALDFRGAFAGNILLSAPSDVTLELAANLLGLEPDSPEVGGKGADALGEMLNIIGGALLKEWFGASSDFEMGIPEVRRMSDDKLAQETANAALHFPMITEQGYRIDAAVLKQPRT